MKKIIVLVAWTALLFGVTGVQAVEFVNGGYVGGKLGVNFSSSSGEIRSPNEGSIAYGLQGGYLQGGYVISSKTLLFAAQAFVDWNPAERHTNGVYYGSRAYGAEIKVGLPFGRFLPYTKLGYGYSTGTRDLNAVADTSVNGSLGLEYKFASQWSVLGEFKKDGYASHSMGASSIANKTITFGINYYLNAPPEIVAPSPVVVEEVEEAPVPIIAPVPVTDAPPI